MQVPVFDGQLLFVGEWPKALSMLRRPHERQRSALPDLTRRCPRLADAKLHGVCHLEKIEIPSRKVAMRRARPETLSALAGRRQQLPLLTQRHLEQGRDRC